MDKKVLVIIVSYNFERWIDHCLGSLRNTEYLVDVVVIDNCSTDHTIELIEKNYPEVRIVANKQNLGFGKANNIGMKIALDENYDAVFLLNQDAWIGANTIGTLVKLYQENTNVGILSPVHLTGKGDNLDAGFATYIGVSKLADLKSTDNLVCVPFINAAFWFIPTSVLRIVGGFSPLFDHTGEDCDYVNRLKYFGYKVGYTPAVFAYHDRENRSRSSKIRFCIEHTYWLSEYANINYSFCKAFGYGVLACIKKSWKALMKKDIIASMTFIRITFKVLRCTCKVIHYRYNYKHINQLQ
ncbi:glycosyl transferase [Bacteroidia bacterium]|nr:glycosyl transferase [Bacteroidia bacterium]